MKNGNIKEVLKSSVNKILKNINRNFTIIIGLVFYLITFITLLKINNYNRNKLMIAYFLVITVLILINFMKKEIYKNENSFPVVNKRFTKKLNDEMVIIPKKDWPDAILYLYDIENYLGK